jgi:hypothetical protein
MATKTIQGANIFKAGTWNSQTFTEDDLDKIVRAFDETGSAGRVPLKFGHSDTDQPFREGLPALGWVTKLWRAGKDLMADFSHIPAEVYAAISNGLFRFTSIELLKNATKDGKKFPFVLDAVALLGAEPPAVDGLADLQRLTAAREFPAMKYVKRLSFKMAPADQIIGKGGAETTSLLPLTISGVMESDLETIASTAVPLNVWIGLAIAGHITKIVRKGDAINVAIEISPDVQDALNAGKYGAIVAVTGATKGILRGAKIEGLDMSSDPPKFSREVAGLREQLRIVTAERDAARAEALTFQRGDIKEVQSAEAKRVLALCLESIRTSTSLANISKEWNARYDRLATHHREMMDMVSQGYASTAALFSKPTKPKKH